ncbi:hypothetical protein BIW11_03826 [Tropilaelaps mercedesae]|uniref:Uncharacterized protein n=1 Tax=Tropilaelaps mercedesae TaxID=418985 RepID=A0A1V9XF45_9ACAR|nr:hypothetical protein BIW11_03826 [Tropilaelaps mercedesae]
MRFDRIVSISQTRPSRWCTAEELSRWKTFVRKHVREIQQLTSSEERLREVGVSNSADMATPGRSAGDLVKKSTEGLVFLGSSTCKDGDRHHDCSEGIDAFKVFVDDDGLLRVRSRRTQSNEWNPIRIPDDSRPAILLVLPSHHRFSSQAQSADQVQAFFVLEGTFLTGPFATTEVDFCNLFCTRSREETVNNCVGLLIRASIRVVHLEVPPDIGAHQAPLPAVRRLVATCPSRYLPAVYRELLPHAMKKRISLERLIVFSETVLASKEDDRTRAAIHVSAGDGPQAARHALLLPSD